MLENVGAIPRRIDENGHRVLNVLAQVFTLDKFILLLLAFDDLGEGLLLQGLLDVFRCLDVRLPAHDEVEDADTVWHKSNLFLVGILVPRLLDCQSWIKDAHLLFGSVAVELAVAKKELVGDLHLLLLGHLGHSFVLFGFLLVLTGGLLPILGALVV